VLQLRQRVEMTFITATTMPLLIALAEIGLRDGVMLPSNAAALVGAGVISVLVFPAVAAAINRAGKTGQTMGEAATATGALEEAQIVTDLAPAPSVPDARGLLIPGTQRTRRWWRR
jgi:hypothetical protein